MVYASRRHRQLLLYPSARHNRWWLSPGRVPQRQAGLCDISKRQDIERMMIECVEALGGLDVLVNNGGIAGPTAPVAELGPDEWVKVWQWT